MAIPADNHPGGAVHAVAAHLWVAGTITTVTASIGAGLAGLLMMVDMHTAFYLNGPGPRTDEIGRPLRGFDYFWSQYGVWLFDAGVGLAVVVAAILAWRFVLRGSAGPAWAACITTCALSCIPLLVNATRAS